MQLLLLLLLLLRLHLPRLPPNLWRRSKQEHAPCSSTGLQKTVLEQQQQQQALLTQLLLRLMDRLNQHSLLNMGSDGKIVARGIRMHLIPGGANDGGLALSAIAVAEGILGRMLFLPRKPQKQEQRQRQQAKALQERTRARAKGRTREKPQLERTRAKPPLGRTRAKTQDS
jgi:hypothetical protein